MVPVETLRAVEILANNVLSNAKKLRRRPGGKKAYTNLITLVASFDELVNLVDLSLRPALTTYSSRVGPRRKVKATRVAPAPVPDPYFQQFYDSGPPPPAAGPVDVRVSPINTTYDWMMSGYGGHGRRSRPQAPQLAPEVQATVNRAAAAAEAYRQTRLEQPRAVQGMEEVLHVAEQRDGGTELEQVQLFSTCY